MSEREVAETDCTNKSDSARLVVLDYSAGKYLFYGYEISNITISQALE